MTARVVTLGESMGLLRVPGIGSFADSGSATIDTGGAEGNVAIGLARLDVPVAWLGRVGDDSMGRRVLRDLRGEGVEVHAVVDPAASTGLMLKESRHTGTTDVRYYRSASAGSRLEVGDLRLLPIATASLLHVTGISLAISETSRAAVHAAVDIAISAGVTVSFDVNHRSRLWSAADAVPHYRELIARADLVFAGVDEAALVLGHDSDPAALAAELGVLVDEVIVKCGAAGAVSSVTGVVHRVPSVPVAVADTVGAGDAFVAGYLAARLAGADAGDRLRLGARTGAFACRHPGDWQGAARRTDLVDDHDGLDPVRR